MARPKMENKRKRKTKGDYAAARQADQQLTDYVEGRFAMQNAVARIRRELGY